MTSVLFASRHLLTAVRDSKFVIPTAIPFERLRARELEECVYWLLDSMGAQELVWRVGTQGRSAADSGRDIEAHFHIASPNADLVVKSGGSNVRGESRLLRQVPQKRRRTTHKQCLRSMCSLSSRTQRSQTRRGIGSRNGNALTRGQLSSRSAPLFANFIPA